MMVAPAKVSISLAELLGIPADRLTSNPQISDITADSREVVDAFFAEAFANCGLERHRPRYWPDYRVYCAFVSDPDGNNIEAVHKERSAV